MTIIESTSGSSSSLSEEESSDLAEYRFDIGANSSQGSLFSEEEEEEEA